MALYAAAQYPCLAESYEWRRMASNLPGFSTTGDRTSDPIPPKLQGVVIDADQC